MCHPVCCLFLAWTGRNASIRLSGLAPAPTGRLSRLTLFFIQVDICEVTFEPSCQKLAATRCLWIIAITDHFRPSVVSKFASSSKLGDCLTHVTWRKDKLVLSSHSRTKMWTWIKLHESSEWTRSYYLA